MKRKKIEKILNAEKIAAGEVVERPANVIKELIENSIDAEATEIKINIKKSGKLLIQIIDNGVGIPSEELDIAFKRYTSSKIRSIEDLQHLSTLGFRGEALSSIAAVSKVNITSRTEDQKTATQLIIEGGKVLERNTIASSIGTNIIIKNLFYNIPARQKFLKSDSTELGHITDIIQRYSLAYPEIHFIYTHNELTMLNCPSQNDLKTTVFHIYGKNIAKMMEDVQYQEKGYLFNLRGLIGHPEIGKKNRNYSSLFINKRYVKSDLLFEAIKEAYEGTLMVKKNPFYVINLEVDPSIIDFNIHPKKLHIRFEDDEFIQNKVYNILRNFVEDYFIKKEMKYISTSLNKYSKNETETYNLLNNLKEKKVQKESIIKDGKKEDDEKIIDEIKKIDINNEEIGSIDTNLNQLELKEIKHSESLKPIDNNSVQLDLNENTFKKKSSQFSDSYIRSKLITKENFPKIKLISYTGQLSNKTYIVLEGINENNEKGLFLLDQHAASERINKEYFQNIINNSKMIKQQLISPLKVELSPREKAFLDENLDEIKQLGFNFESFGGNTYILREIPTLFNKLIEPEIIKDIISDITEIGKDRSFLEVKGEIINYLSCHRSIRGGDSLSLKDIRKLLIDLANCKNPFHCAHGRPTMKFISFKEMDKYFKRTG